MRMIDGDALMELLTTAIRNMQGMAKFLEAEDDPEIQMEIKAYTDIAKGVKDMPTIEPERKTGKWLIRKFGLDAQCSECGMRFNDVYDLENSDAFCRNCGAKMEGLERWES